MAGKELGEDLISSTDLEEQLDSDIELIPDTFQDNIIDGLRTKPRNFVGALGGKLLGFGSWLLKSGSVSYTHLTLPTN